MIRNPTIYYIKGFDPFPAEEEKKFLNLLNDEKAKRIRRLVFPKDRSRSIYGLLLLRKIMHDSGYLDFELKQLKHPRHEKPYIDKIHNKNRIDFNIAHSGEVVICACISDAMVGIDTEVLQNKHHKLSNRFMTKEEMLQVGDSEESFLELWTKKEALIKVDPKGRLMQLKSIEILPQINQGRINSRQYYLQSFKVSKSTFTQLACSIPIENVTFERISPQDTYI